MPSSEQHLERLKRDAFSCGVAEELLLALQRIDAMDKRIADLEHDR